MARTPAYPDLGTAGSSVVVVVHDDVNEQVQGDDNPLLKVDINRCLLCWTRETHDRSLAFQLVLAKNGGSGMVEDVQECWRKGKLSVAIQPRTLPWRLTQLLLLEDQEHGVDQFHVFEVVVDNVV